MPYAAATVKVAPLSCLYEARGDEVRLRIVAPLTHGELRVCHIHEALALTQSNASRRLAILRTAGIVACERRDKWVYYWLAAPADAPCARVLKSMPASFADEPQQRRDAERLARTKGLRSCK